MHAYVFILKDEENFMGNNIITLDDIYEQQAIL